MSAIDFLQRYQDFAALNPVSRPTRALQRAASLELAACHWLGAVLPVSIGLTLHLKTGNEYVYARKESIRGHAAPLSLEESVPASTIRSDASCSGDVCQCVDATQTVHGQQSRGFRPHDVRSGYSPPVIICKRINLYWVA